MDWFKGEEITYDNTANSISQIKLISGHSTGVLYGTCNREVTIDLHSVSWVSVDNTFVNRCGGGDVSIDDLSNFAGAFFVNKQTVTALKALSDRGTFNASGSAL